MTERIQGLDVIRGIAIGLALGLVAGGVRRRHVGTQVWLSESPDLAYAPPSYAVPVAWQAWPC